MHLQRCAALECSLLGERLQKATDAEPDLSPQGRVVRFKDDPLRAIGQAVFQIDLQAPDGKVGPGQAGLLLGSAGSPNDITGDDKLTENIDTLRMQVCIFPIRHDEVHIGYAARRDDGGNSPGSIVGEWQHNPSGSQAVYILRPIAAIGTPRGDRIWDWPSQHASDVTE